MPDKMTNYANPYGNDIFLTKKEFEELPTKQFGDSQLHLTTGPFKCKAWQDNPIAEWFKGEYIRNEKATEDMPAPIVGYFKWNAIRILPEPASAEWDGKQPETPRRKSIGDRVYRVLKVWRNSPFHVVTGVLNHKDTFYCVQETVLNWGTDQDEKAAVISLPGCHISFIPKRFLFDNYISNPTKEQWEGCNDPNQA